MAISARRDRVVGVLGGMGPYATTLFMQNVLELTPAKKDWDHVHMVVDCNVKLPSRTRAVLFQEESPFEGMLDSLKRLSAWPVDFIVIPCNSAHYWRRDLQRRIKVPILDIVDMTVQELAAQGAGGHAVVLSGYVPWISMSYKKPLENAGFFYHHLGEDDQRQVENFIARIKIAGNGKGIEEDFRLFISSLQARFRSDFVILACAELTVFKGMNRDGIRFIDSNEALARAVVKYANGNIPLDFSTKMSRDFWNTRAKRLADNRLGLFQSTMLTADEAEAERRWVAEKRNVFGFLEKVALPDHNILEPGCGTGRWSRELARLVKHVTAFDPCERFIEKARDLSVSADPPIHNIDYRVDEITTFQTERRFQGIFSSGLLLYLSDEEVIRLWEMVSMLLMAGGWLLMKESIAIERRLELHGYYSEVLNEEYYSIYRTQEELLAGLDIAFDLVDQRVILSPTEQKPETCQKVFLLRRKA